MKVLHLDENHPSLAIGIAKLGLENHFDFSSGVKKICKQIDAFEGLVIRSRFPIDRVFLGKATKLQFIIRVGAGLENIDTEYAKKRGIHLITAPEGNANAVGEHALGMLLTLFNRINTANTQIKESGKWLREANRGEELGGKTVGIIGYGNMGKSFARKLTGFAVKVLCYDLKAGVGDDFATQVSLKTLQQESHVISLHTSENALSQKMINSDFITGVHHPFYLINTARGSGVVTKDLVEALHSGKVRGACLDVLEYEKPSFERFFHRKTFKELLSYANVLLSPHIAGWSYQSHEKLAKVCVEKLRHFLSK